MYSGLALFVQPLSAEAQDERRQERRRGQYNYFTPQKSLFLEVASLRVSVAAPQKIDCDLVFFVQLLPVAPQGAMGHERETGRVGSNPNMTFRIEFSDLKNL